MSRRVNLRSKNLSEADLEYISQRSWMIRERGEIEALRNNGADIPETDEREVSVEEWVANATKPQIVAELSEREIEFDPKSRKDDLGQLLINAVNEENDEDESSE